MNLLKVSASRFVRSTRVALPLLGLVALLSAAGCRKNEEKKPEAETKTTAAADDTKKTARAPKDEGIEVPTEEDFEGTAEAQITETSDLQKELDAIEKQIGQ